jgi:hypothetical protein
MTDKHRCENMPDCVEIHKDIVAEVTRNIDYWVINIHPRENRKDATDTIFGGTHIINCGWCGIKLEYLK